MLIARLSFGWTLLVAATSGWRPVWQEEEAPDCFVWPVFSVEEFGAGVGRKGPYCPDFARIHREQAPLRKRHTSLLTRFCVKTYNLFVKPVRSVNKFQTQAKWRIAL